MNMSSEIFLKYFEYWFHWVPSSISSHIHDGSESQCTYFVTRNNRYILEHTKNSWNCSCKSETTFLVFENLVKWCRARAGSMYRASKMRALCHLFVWGTWGPLKVMYQKTSKNKIKVFFNFWKNWGHLPFLKSLRSSPIFEKIEVVFYFF